MPPYYPQPMPPTALRDPATAPAPRLTPLSQLRSQPRPLFFLPALMATAAVLFGVSMFFVWHRVYVNAAQYTDVPGYRAGNWMIVAAVLVLALATRFARWGFGTYGKWALAAIVFGCVVGIDGEYIDSGARAAEAFADPYHGPGFFIAVAGIALLALSMVISWRTED
jgi:hypothetical protein